MKIVRNKRTQFYFGMLMASAMFLTSCKKAIITPDESQVAQTETSTYEKSGGPNGQGNPNNPGPLVMSGEDWFKSVSYADGPATPYINALDQYSPVAQGLNATELTHYRAIEDAVIAEINTQQPTFFSEFKVAMESKDPVIISDKIESSKMVIYEAVKEVMADEGFDVDQEMADYMQQIGAENFKPASVAVIVVIVIAIAIALNLTITKTKVSCGADPISCNYIGFQGAPNTLPTNALAAQIANLP